MSLKEHVKLLQALYVRPSKRGAELTCGPVGIRTVTRGWPVLDRRGAVWYPAA